MLSGGEQGEGGKTKDNQPDFRMMLSILGLNSDKHTSSHNTMYLLQCKKQVSEVSL